MSEDLICDAESFALEIKRMQMCEYGILLFN